MQRKLDNVHLLGFLMASEAEIKAGASIKRFLYLRYDAFNILFPHKTFSVNQATPDFFTLTLEYARQQKEFIKPKSEYEKNYLDWMLQYFDIIIKNEDSST